MPYRYVIEKSDYTDYASGRVFHGAPGHPAFPIRLASEITQACFAHRVKRGLTDPCVLYDPVCGGAYHLSVIAYLHWEKIHTVIGSDVDNDILATAERNLGMLSLKGLDKRIQEIETMSKAYGKKSHADALTSAHRLRKHLLQRIRLHRMDSAVFCADAMDSAALKRNLGGITPDIAIADIPYGIRSRWHLVNPAIRNPIMHMLSSLLPILSNGAIVAIAADKGSKISHPLYRRIERFQIGKRKVILLASIQDVACVSL